LADKQTKIKGKVVFEEECVCLKVGAARPRKISFEQSPKTKRTRWLALKQTIPGVQPIYLALKNQKVIFLPKIQQRARFLSV